MKKELKFTSREDGMLDEVLTFDGEVKTESTRIIPEGTASLSEYLRSVAMSDIEVSLDGEVLGMGTVNVAGGEMPTEPEAFSGTATQEPETI